MPAGDSGDSSGRSRAAALCFAAGVVLIIIGIAATSVGIAYIIKAQRLKNSSTARFEPQTWDARSNFTPRGGKSRSRARFTPNPHPRRSTLGSYDSGGALLGIPYRITDEL